MFGAESFLFCLSSNFNILDKDGKLQSLGDWRKHWKARTPYGSKKLQIIKHENSRQLPKIRLCYDGGIIEATSNHVLMLESKKWREFGEVLIGDKLCGLNGFPCVNQVELFSSIDAIGVRSESGVYYGCVEGEPVLIH